MNNKITLGIPRALLYYKYHVLWYTFFKELDVDVLISPETNDEIIEIGNKKSLSEMCLPLKSFIGHVGYLIDKVDYIFIPIISSIEKNNRPCINLYALYDILKNTYDINIIEYNVDVNKGIDEETAFIKMGKKLGYSRELIIRAYKIAKKEEYKQNKIRYLLQTKKLKRSKLKILIASYSYNLYNNKIIFEIEKYLRKKDVEIIYSDILDPDNNNDFYKDISNNLNWTYDKELINSIFEKEKYVDGIIFISTFPCGSISIINELNFRNISKDYIEIMIDKQYKIDDIIYKIDCLLEKIKKGDMYE